MIQLNSGGLGKESLRRPSVLVQLQVAQLLVVNSGPIWLAAHCSYVYAVTEAFGIILHSAWATEYIPL